MHAASDSIGSTNFSSTFSSLLKYAHRREQQADVLVRVGGEEKAKGVAGVLYINIVTSLRPLAQ